MDTSRQEYPALLASLQPEQAVSVLSDRIYVINKVNSDIADWLQERRKVEETYAAGLRKLARRPQQDGASALGIFQMPWQRIVAGAENMAQSHETLAAKIQSDVETPLREFQSKNRETQNISTTQGNLASIAKELANAQKKDQSKSKTQNKLEEAGREWESQAPFVFEQLQALDETRVNHLRDVLTQLETHEVDQVERNRTSAESCLNALLNIETADEIKTFAARVAGGRASIPRRASSATASTNPRPTSAMGPPPTPPPPRNTRVPFNQRAGSDAGQDTLTPLPEKKSSLGGLKRLGTVMGRRKDKAPPPAPSSSEKRKEKGRSLMPFRRGESSRSFQDLESTGADFTPTRPSQNDISQYQQPRLEPVSTQQTEDSFVAPVPMTNGTNLPHTPDRTEIAPQPSHLPEPLRPQHQFPPPQELSAGPATPEYTSPTEAMARAQQEALSASSEPDETARNLTIRDKPIQEDASEAQLAMSNVANTLRMQAQSSGLNRVPGSVRGRRDVRNTMFVPSTSSMQESPATNTNTASESATSGIVPTLATGLVATGGAAVASEGLSDLASPIKYPQPSAPVLEDTQSPQQSQIQPQPTTTSDAGSIHSTHSLGSVVQHPDLTEPGLNASIIETVNTWFGPDGSVQRSFAVGEIALAFNASGSGSTEKEAIRLENFQVLEKVAMNPSFVSNSEKGEAGEYTVDTTSIRRMSPTVALKYQLHLDEKNLGVYSPVKIVPAWQCQEGMASVIVVLSLNSDFGGVSGAEGLTLRNIVVSVSLDSTGEEGVKASSAMMKPLENASFKRKAGAVVWRLGEVTLTPGSDGEKLLVRFLTTAGVPRRGGIDVKFEVVGRCGSFLGVQRLGGAVGAGEKERDPFADESVSADGKTEGDVEGEGGKRWEDIKTVRRLIGGKYAAT